MPQIEDISKIITTINPDRYFNGTPNELREFKNLKKEKGFWEAVGKADSKAAEEHKLVYDSSSETLEPVYFWILDMMTNTIGKPEKLIDNFTSSPGSGHFSELMGKATHMQEQAMKIMQTNGVLIKSIVNIIYDLKEFEIRLSQYKAANSKDKNEAEAGLLALKQIWMDNVDIKRGAGSINALASGNLNFVTLRDAFMVAKSLEEVKDMDLNDRVKRILEPRLLEFLKWRDLSEKELKKRYEIEKTYLKNQLASLKLYTRWAKPYLRAAAELEQKELKRAADVVTAFNTIRLELTLLSKKAFDFIDAVFNKKLPDAFRKVKLKRPYYSCVLIDFYFRGIPQKAGQHYVFGGRVEATFRAYALNEDEIEMLNKKLDESDVNDALKLATGMTEDSLKELQEDIDYFLKSEEDREKENKKEEKKGGENVNPFAALFGMTGKKPAKEEKEKITEIKPDSYVEKLVRNLAETTARDNCFTVYDIYKKSHDMASQPYSPETEVIMPKSKWNTLLGI